jgi:hypothetical protein
VCCALGWHSWAIVPVNPGSWFWNCPKCGRVDHPGPAQNATDRAYRYPYDFPQPGDVLAGLALIALIVIVLWWMAAYGHP